MTNTTGLKIEHALGQLALRRPVFHSEADFQFALAIIVNELYPTLAVRLEIPVSKQITLDMLITEPEANEFFAIELKYKTALWEGTIRGEDYHLKNHGADDIGCYDVLKDVERVETLVSNGFASAGAVILLTNEPLYWNIREQKSKITNAHEFRIHEGLTVSGQRSWGPNTGGSSKGRERPLTLAGSFPIQWQDYSDVEGRRGQFRKLVFQVGKLQP